jgi:hypothetical protein
VMGAHGRLRFDFPAMGPALHALPNMERMANNNKRGASMHCVLVVAKGPFGYRWSFFTRSLGPLGPLAA